MRKNAKLDKEVRAAASTIQNSHSFLSWICRSTVENKCSTNECKHSSSRAGLHTGENPVSIQIKYLKEYQLHSGSGYYSTYCRCNLN